MSGASAAGRSHSAEPQAPEDAPAARSDVRAAEAAPAPPEATAEPAAPPAVPATAAPSEAAQLGEALRLLRRARDPAGALGALDRFDAAFPRGVLALESQVARVQALVALGRAGEALARLDALPSGTLDDAPELRVLRGELRASHGRCPEALVDFARALGADPGGVAHERALYGRGVCRSRLGDRAGAAADFARYEAEYPRGRFSDEVRRAR